MLSDNQKISMRNLITLLVVLLHLNACMLLNTRQRKIWAIRIGISFNADLNLEREFKLRADSEPDPGTSKKFNLNMFAYLKPIIGSQTYLGKY
jgi:hypothetical protein